MKWVLSTILSVLVIGTIQAKVENIDQQWEEYKRTYYSKFTNFIDENHRKILFERELNYIKAHNAKFNKGLVSYEIGLNKFSIYTEDEMRPYVEGLNETLEEQNLPMQSLDEVDVDSLPSTIDWRERGVINAVKNQGPCGSCWIFSALSAMEAAYAIQKRMNVSLSEQQLVDCLHGCAGGSRNHAYKYIIDNNGVEYDRYYPYVGKAHQTCRFDPSKPVATLNRKLGGDWGHVQVKSGDEIALQKAVATIGPISVGLDAGGDFGKYKSGVYFSSPCKKRNHAVTIVGYGRENGQDYWLVRNSWGAAWGDKGYIKMARNRNNYCFIASYALYPVI